MKMPKREVAIRCACVLALAALGMFVWSVLDPRPIPVILAMSVGQVLGTLSLAILLGVVALDLRAAERTRASSASPPPRAGRTNDL